MKKNIELIMFDLDGTLVDSMKDITNAGNFTLENFGLMKKSEQEITSYVGDGREHLVKKLLGDKQNFLKEAVSVFGEYYKKHSMDNSILYPNVKEVLEYFKDKKKAVVSNKNHEEVVSNLKSLAIYDYFKNIIGGDEVEYIKPSPFQLCKTMQGFHVNEKKSIMVGDMDIDILAGKNAGILTCAVTYGVSKKEDIIRAEPDFIIDDIIKLKDIIC
ncbi:MAG: HAD-IA family hydrolase [bacterium]|nr:HAD-IA family hydrolase [bacterium]